MKRFFISFIGFSSVYIIIHLLLGNQLDGRKLAVILSGGLMFAILREAFSLLFKRLRRWLG